VLIIVEGLDRTGKTTLSQAIKRETGTAYIHFAKPTAHPLDEYVEPVIDCPHAVFDRYHWGEMVWPQIFGRETECDWRMFLYIELALQSRGAVVVHAQRDLDAVEAACVRDGEPLVADKIKPANHLFRIARERSILPVWDWSWGESFVQICGQAAARASWSRRCTRITHRFIGEDSPDVLLVGDVAGPTQEATRPLPFVPFKNTSGHYLMGALTYLVPKLKPAIVNAKQPDGVRYEPLAELWEEMGEPPIIALGSNAAARLEQLKLEYNQVVHPQYARRFLRSEGEEGYAKKIEEAA